MTATVAFLALAIAWTVSAMIETVSGQNADHSWTIAAIFTVGWAVLKKLEEWTRA